MEVMMTYAEALDLAARNYRGDSKPLSRVVSGDEPHSEQWWISNPRFEEYFVRVWGGVQTYFAIAEESIMQIPEYCFPAEFSFSDRKRGRPDKGVIKSLLRRGYIEPVRQGDELFFRLSQQGARDYRTFIGV